MQWTFLQPTKLGVLSPIHRKANLLHQIVMKKSEVFIAGIKLEVQAVSVQKAWTPYWL